MVGDREGRQIRDAQRPEIDLYYAALRDRINTGQDPRFRDRAGSSSANFRIYALPATNVSVTPPSVVKILNTNGISGGTIGLVAIGVASDGAIYACNVDTAGGWKLYRWANSDSNTEPVMVFQGEPSGSGTAFRWGDVMDVRGSGANTQIIIDNQNITTSGGRYVSVLYPTNEFMTNWGVSPNLLEAYGGNTSIGRSLQFGAGDTFWQKQVPIHASRTGTFSSRPSASSAWTNPLNSPQYASR